MISSLVGAVIMSAATVAMLVALNMSNQAIKKVGKHPITEQEKEAMKEAMLDGWRSSQFTRRCNTKQGILRHKKLLSESKGGKPLKDNRYQPNGGLRGQYDEPLNPTTKPQHANRILFPYQLNGM